MKISTEYPTFKKDNMLLSVITKSVQTTKKSVIGIPLIVKIHLILQFRGEFRGVARGPRPLIFRRNWGQKGRKTFFQTPPPHLALSQGLGDRVPPQQPASKLSYFGKRSESRVNARASGEAARGRGKESWQRPLINFHLYFAQTKGNTIGWKMTFRKTKLIDNRPSWHSLRLRDKFGSQGDQIGTENLFQPSKQTRGLVWFSSRKENIASRG